MEFLPIFLNISGRPCLVVGGGEVAARKIEMLCGAGARVRVVSPALCSGVSQQVEQGSVEYHAGTFSESDLEGCELVIAATDDAAVNRQVAELARSRRIPVNVVDDPEQGSFIVPSIIDRSPVVAAVSTGGRSPVLARLVRARLETLIPAAYGRLADLAARWRERVQARFSNSAERKAFWEQVLGGAVAEMVFSGQEELAEKALEKALSGDEAAIARTGAVYLVGAGPGDPDLLTFRALRLMQQADVVVYDRLVSPQVMSLVRRDAELVYVGKERDKHTLPQEQINDLLVKLAKQGKRVVRLKGGDPFVFGRGGEEIETLSAEGVPFQVVPGITAAAGCAAYSGIPLTHRDFSQTLNLVTGHLKDGTTNLNWPALAQPNQTTVFYMGLKGLPIICAELIRHGLPEQTPIALVQKGTTPQQKVFIGTLGTMPALVEGATIKPPTLIIVGEVVRLHDKLAWFDPEAGIGQPRNPSAEQTAGAREASRAGE